jgi:hypothetical protein
LPVVDTQNPFKQFPQLLSQSSPHVPLLQTHIGGWVLLAQMSSGFENASGSVPGTVESVQTPDTG